MAANPSGTTKDSDLAGTTMAKCACHRVSSRVTDQDQGFDTHRHAFQPNVALARLDAELERVGGWGASLAKEGLPARNGLRVLDTDFDIDDDAAFASLLAAGGPDEDEEVWAP